MTCRGDAISLIEAFVKTCKQLFRTVWLAVLPSLLPRMNRNEKRQFRKTHHGILRSHLCLTTRQGKQAVWYCEAIFIAITFSTLV
ncbi:hypothetical protein Cob_v010763 [Colletotrichum orbiculare MAFF 240422]|uniref:Uncharacterized protein n=1 Tax=Colletotrichum orbiculare (strain 104-T / ATCC 96160 / CBS 514.97 / LARS 414 / MAFF 240422) TaxID=1213857 RepID=A0A484FFL5_COLOR|nr:hypothetical protein Cob_v010763 [Colletotrichum orbiculare MAFF 240422]